MKTHLSDQAMMLGATSRRNLVWLDLSSPEIWDSASRPVGDGPKVGSGERSSVVNPLPQGFFSSGSSSSGGAGEEAHRHDAVVTTVDQSGIRVLDNALNDPTGASSLYGRASAPKYRPKGGTRVPPIRTHIVDWPAAPPLGATELLQGRFDSPTSGRQEHLLAGDRPDESRQLTATAVTTRVAGLPFSFRRTRRL